MTAYNVTMDPGTEVSFIDSSPFQPNNNSTSPEYGEFSVTPFFPSDFDDYIRSRAYPHDKMVWQESMPTWEVALKILFYVPVIIVSLVGNGLVLTVIVKKRSLRKNVTNVLLINLLISDIIVTCTSTWVHLIDDLSYKWVLGPFFCKANVFVQVLALISAALTMTAISTERFFGIVVPFSVCAHHKMKTVIAVPIIWIVAVTGAIPPVLYTQLHRREWLDFEEVWCSPIWPDDISLDSLQIRTRAFYYTIVAVLLYFIPLVIMTCSYTAIIIKLRQKQNELSEMNNNNQKVKNSQRKRVVVMLIILLAVFTVCWSPFQITMLHYEYEAHGGAQALSTHYERFTYFARYMSFLNSACNPIIFICFSQKIRRAIHSLLCQKKVRGLKRSPSSRYGSLRSSTRRTWV